MASPENKLNEDLTTQAFRRISYYPDLPQLRIMDSWTLAVVERRRMHLFAPEIPRDLQPFNRFRLIRKDIRHNLDISPKKFDAVTAAAAIALSGRHFEKAFDASKRRILNTRAGKWSLRQLGKSLLKVSGGEIVDAYFDQPDAAALIVTGYNWRLNQEISSTIVEMSKLAKIPKDVIPYTQAAITSARMTAREAKQHESLLRSIRRALRNGDNLRDVDDYEQVARAVVRG